MRLSPWLISGLVLCGCATSVPHKVWSLSKPAHVGPVPLAVLVRKAAPAPRETAVLFAISPLLVSGPLALDGCTWTEQGPELREAGPRAARFVHNLLLANDYGRIEQLWRLDPAGVLTPARVEDHVRDGLHGPFVPATYFSHVCSTADRALLLRSSPSAGSAYRVILRKGPDGWHVERVELEWVE